MAQDQTTYRLGVLYRDLNQLARQIARAQQKGLPVKSEAAAEVALIKEQIRALKAGKDMPATTPTGGRYSAKTVGGEG